MKMMMEGTHKLQRRNIYSVRATQDEQKETDKILNNSRKGLEEDQERDR